VVLDKRAMRLCVAIGMAALLFACLPALVATAGEVADSPSPRYIAIVIDDMGNGMKGTEEILRLPIKLTVAVMPFLPTTKRDAELAHQMGHDVIVHMPMEPVRGKASWLGPGAILTSLSDEEIRRRVEAAIDDVPHAVGMNNHMGSKATADERVMRIVLEVCKERGLFFLDSRTSWKTVVPQIARELHLPQLHNDVFLDDVHSFQHVTRQIGLIRKALEHQEACVAIGHVGPPGQITAGALKKAIPALQAEAQFVRLSELASIVEVHQGLKPGMP